MSAQAPSAPRRSFVRGRRLCCLVAALLIVAAVFFLSSSQVHRALIEWAAPRVLGLHVRLDPPSLFGRVETAGLELYASDRDLARGRPIVRASSVSLPYRMSLGAKRFFPSLDINGLTIALEGEDPEDTNYGPLLASFSAPARADRSTGLLRWIPERINIERAEMQLSTPDFRVDVSPIRVESQVHSMRFFSAHASSDDLVLRIDNGNERTFTGGRFNVELVANEAHTRTSFEAHIPDVLEAKGNTSTLGFFALSLTGVTFDTLRVQGAPLAGLLPVPLRFDSIDLSGTNVRGGGADNWGVLLDTSIRLEARGLSYGEEGHEWYEGDLRITGEGSRRASKLNATLNRGQQITVDIEGNIESGNGIVTLADWSRDDLEAAMPKDWRPVLSSVPNLKRLTGTAEILWNEGAFELDARVDPAFAPTAGKSETFLVTAKGTGSTRNSRRALFDGVLDIRLGAGRVEATVNARRADDIEIHSAVSGIEMDRWSSLVPGLTLPDGVKGTVAGRIKVHRKVGATSIDVNVSTASATVLGVNFPNDPPLAVSGRLVMPADKAEIASDRIELKFADDAIASFQKFRIDTDKGSFSTALESSIDFDYAAPLLDLPGLTGVLKLNGPLRYEGGKLALDFRATGDGFGVTPYAAPYGVPLTAAGSLDYNVDSGKGFVSHVNGEWGDGTTLTSDRLAIHSSPFTVEGPIRIESDLQPLVHLRYLDAVEGRADIRGTIRAGMDGLTSSLELDAATTMVTLSDALAVLGGLSVEGTLAWGPAMDGELRFAAAQGAAAGAILKEILGQCTLESGILTANSVRGTLYGGKLEADVAWNLMSVMGEGRVNARLEGIDLERFCKEYEVPSVRLTGLAHGDVRLEWNKNALRAFEVTLESTERFSLNRETIEQLLLTAVTGEVRGLKLFNRRIRKKTIGDAPMRKFDQAKLSLTLTGDTYETQRLIGPVTLESDTLDFTIDLGVDVRAVADAVTLKQQARLDEVDSISSDPVQWKSVGDGSPRGN
ncbi:MAG: hypothetical protein AMXMBFR4_18200 [Candidatus Hydrogenedentota bacterium]